MIYLKVGSQMRRKTKLELKGQDQLVKAANAAFISAVIHDNQPGPSPSSAPSADPVGRFGARIKLARKSVTRFAKKELVQTGKKNIIQHCTYFPVFCCRLNLDHRPMFFSSSRTESRWSHQILPRLPVRTSIVD